MIVKTKKVYYCEHCGRHRLTPQSIRDHEKSCTANPDRVCRMGCENGIDLPSIVAALKARYEIVEIEEEAGIWGPIRTLNVEWIGEPITIDEVLTITEGCPACTLAVLRQARLHRWPLADEVGRWDFKEAKDAWWRERNRERMVEEAWAY